MLNYFFQIFQFFSCNFIRSRCVGSSHLLSSSFSPFSQAICRQLCVKHGSENKKNRFAIIFSLFSPAMLELFKYNGDDSGEEREEAESHENEISRFIALAR